MWYTLPQHLPPHLSPHFFTLPRPLPTSSHTPPPTSHLYPPEHISHTSSTFQHIFLHLPNIFQHLPILPSLSPHLSSPLTRHSPTPQKTSHPFHIPPPSFSHFPTPFLHCPPLSSTLTHFPTFPCTPTSLTLPLPQHISHTSSHTHIFPNTSFLNSFYPSHPNTLPHSFYIYPILDQTSLSAKNSLISFFRPP